MSTTRASDVLETIHSIMHLYRSRQFRELRDGPYELTHMEFKVLAFFARQPGASPRELVAHSGRDKAQIARLIQGLRQRELLDGRPDPHDKRSICLHPTQLGREVFQVVEKNGQRLSDLALKNLSVDERQHLEELLQKVQLSLDSES